MGGWPASPLFQTLGGVNMPIKDNLPSELKMVIQTARSDFQGVIALFVGDSGTGKTMTAEILAKYLNLDFLRIGLSGVVSKYIGETEKNLHKLFDAAEDSGAVLFFDDADALMGKRTGVKDNHDRYANVETDYLLRRLERFHGIVVLASNKRADIDKTFLKKIPHVLVFPLCKA